MLKNIIVFLICMLPFTVNFWKMIVDEKGIYKVKAIVMLIGLYDLKIIFAVNNQPIKLTVIDCVFMIIGIIWGYVYSILFVMKSKDSLGKISAIIVWGYVAFVFSISALKIQQMELLYISKVWLMLTLLAGLLALRNLSVFGQIVGAIILYIIMISANAILSTEFLSAADKNQLWKGIYESIQRSYSLNPINNQVTDINLITNIVDFLMCKVMDVILLGFLSARFMEIVGESKSRNNLTNLQ